MQTSFHLTTEVLLSCLWFNHPWGLRALQEQTLCPNKLFSYKHRRQRTPDVQKELGVDLRIRKDDEYGPWNRALSNVISICWVINPVFVQFSLQSEFNGKVFQSENTGPLKNAILYVNTNNHLWPNKTLFIYKTEVLHFYQLIKKWLVLRIHNPDGKSQVTHPGRKHKQRQNPWKTCAQGIFVPGFSTEGMGILAPLQGPQLRPRKLCEWQMWPSQHLRRHLFQYICLVLKFWIGKN